MVDDHSNSENDEHFSAEENEFEDADEGYSSVEQLPMEMHHEILDKLNLSGILSYAATSKTNKRAVDDYFGRLNHVTEVHHKELFNLSASDLLKYLRDTETPFGFKVYILFHLLTNKEFIDRKKAESDPRIKELLSKHDIFALKTMESKNFLDVDENARFRIITNLLKNNKFLTLESFVNSLIKSVVSSKDFAQALNSNNLLSNFLAQFERDTMFYRSYLSDTRYIKDKTFCEVAHAIGTAHEGVLSDKILGIFSSFDFKELRERSKNFHLYPNLLKDLMLLSSKEAVGSLLKNESIYSFFKSDDIKSIVEKRPELAQTLYETMYDLIIHTTSNKETGATAAKLSALLRAWNNNDVISNVLNDNDLLFKIDPLFLSYINELANDKHSPLSSLAQNTIKSLLTNVYYIKKKFTDSQSKNYHLYPSLLADLVLLSSKEVAENLLKNDFIHSFFNPHNIQSIVEKRPELAQTLYEAMYDLIIHTTSNKEAGATAGNLSTLLRTWNNNDVISNVLNDNDLLFKIDPYFLSYIEELANNKDSPLSSLAQDTFNRLLTDVDYIKMKLADSQSRFFIEEKISNSEMLTLNALSSDDPELKHFKLKLMTPSEGLKPWVKDVLSDNNKREAASMITKHLLEKYNISVNDGGIQEILCLVEASKSFSDQLSRDPKIIEAILKSESHGYSVNKNYIYKMAQAHNGLLSHAFLLACKNLSKEISFGGLVSSGRYSLYELTKGSKATLKMCCEEPYFFNTLSSYEISEISKDPELADVLYCAIRNIFCDSPKDNSWDWTNRLKLVALMQATPELAHRMIDDDLFMSAIHTKDESTLLEVFSEITRTSRISKERKGEIAKHFLNSPNLNCLTTKTHGIDFIVMNLCGLSIPMSEHNLIDSDHKLIDFVLSNSDLCSKLNSHTIDFLNKKKRELEKWGKREVEIDSHEELDSDDGNPGTSGRKSRKPR